MGVVASTTGATGAYDIEALARDGQTVLDAAGHPDWELSLLVCDDAFIAPLNQQWRGKTGPTDVLSFPQLEWSAPDEAVDLPPEPVLLGDVVISIETAARQAADLGHSTEDELRVLLVHGLCHLLGHTHEDEGDRDAMNALEGKLLAALGLTPEGLIARATAER
ncbi:MAG: rRNA maturation RNase YbeY [Alphaproteobacteria bacterium]|nr:rRNA maturation RNase YbeY [Alphaproteobacteria bacterium]